MLDRCLLEQRVRPQGPLRAADRAAATHLPYRAAAMPVATPADLLGWSVLGSVLLCLVGFAYELAAPYVALGWSLVSFSLADQVVGDLCDAAIGFFATHMGSFHRFLADVGVPLRVLVKHVLAPIVVGSFVALVIGSCVNLDAAEAPQGVGSLARTRMAARLVEARARKTFLLLAYSLGTLFAASIRQNILSPPARLGKKCVTHGLLVAPCILGWQVAWQDGGPSLATSLFTLPAIGLHASLAAAGANKMSLRGLETGYGAAKVLLAIHATDVLIALYARATAY